MEIRTMTTGDYDGVWQLWMSTPGMGLNDIDDSREGVARFLARNPNTCFVAVSEGGLVGVILSGHDGRRGYIYHMAVAATERNRGIGGTLLDAAMSALEREGISKVALVVFAHNEVGNRFWENRGFTRRDDLVYRNRAIRDLVRIDT